MDAMEDLTAFGLGLDYGTVRLERTSESWLRVGSTVRDDASELLGALALSIEQIGSSSVLGLLAKPVIDLAAGVDADQNLEVVVLALEAGGWIYRGDASSQGGHVFVLEARPWHRVAHLHVIRYDGPEWFRYLRLRDLLRAQPSAAGRYEAVKRRLANQYPDDPQAYTNGKSQVVSELLGGPS